LKLLRELTQLQDERGCLDGETLRSLSAEMRVPLYRLEGLVSFYPHFRKEPPPAATVQICRDVTCAMGGCDVLTQQLRDVTNDRTDVEIQDVSCLGRCDTAPAVAINDEPVTSPSPLELSNLLDLIDHPQEVTRIPSADGNRIWKCNPYADESEHYSTVTSLVASGAALASTSIERLKEAGLRGMGGAGFPTGTKWEFVAREPNQPKYVICNADESEPGTFKDRVLLAELPHLVIEGMLLAGLTIGAENGIVYIRHEYAPERRVLEAAIDAARSAGILGENAAGSGQRFDVEVFVSPGGYILGEETALLEALEDKRGEPRNRPPFPSTHGLWGKPTLINNVETFVLATAIVHHGAEWWSSQGAGDYSGLKVICISGDVERPGVYEIPCGLTVAEVIERAGGMRGDLPLKAFLPGGASTNFLPAACAETPLDFDALRDAGSALGTGAVTVFAEGRDLFALATNIVRFFRNESCGKCVPCRLGTEQTVGLLEDVRAGLVAPSELATLAELGETLEQTSICGLGQVALNPILSMLAHFPDEIPQRTAGD
jgi:NADH:ubiquinone oxidoreductase subunit F (NADH-binding)/NADH:ubiquinone oxidoreductase subunit E